MRVHSRARVNTMRKGTTMMAMVDSDMKCLLIDFARTALRCCKPQAKL